MASVTELILAAFKPEVPADVVTSTLDENTQTLLAQPGCRRVRRSPVHEDPTKMRLFVDWDSIEHHRAFTAKPDVYGPFRARMGAIIDTSAGPRIPPCHVQFTPFPPAVLDVSSTATHTQANAVELLQAYFPAGISDAERKTVENAFHEFTAEMGRFAEGFTSETALGWTVEDDVRFKGGDELCRVLVVLFGWTTVDAHIAARATEGFAHAVLPLRNLERLLGMEMCHVACATTERGI